MTTARRITTPLAYNMAKHHLFRRFQFGVADLLILTAIVAVGLALWRTPNLASYYEPLAEGTTPGQSWAGNGLRMKFRWCPPGEFKMGSPQDEKDRGSDEDQVSVTLTRGFWLGKCEVTQKEYRQVMDNNPSYFPEKERDAALVAAIDVDRLPVDSVSWHDAAEFCRRFTEQEHKAGRLPLDWEYRLPTEAQWEYACRAGTQTRFNFGDEESRLGDFAWYAGNSDDRTHEVGQKLPNAWGLRDMHGNAWEWCRDAYQNKLVGGTDPEVVSEQASYRALRGGSWIRVRRSCASASRYGYAPGIRYGLISFRLAAVQSR